MKATSNTDAELAMGREPTEFSRPTTTSRNGFMEAMGAGVQIVMSARTALEMGAPIQGIVAHTSTHTYVALAPLLSCCSCARPTHATPYI